LALDEQTQKRTTKVSDGGRGKKGKKIFFRFLFLMPFLRFTCVYSTYKSITTDHFYVQVLKVRQSPHFFIIFYRGCRIILEISLKLKSSKPSREAKIVNI
jgi:hypothetical protein